MSEKELVVKAKAGDAKAFTELYGLYKKKLYSYAFYRLGNAPDAEDAVSDCVLSAFEQINKLKKAEAFSSWIFRILYCCCTSAMKEQIRQSDTDNIDDYVNGSETELAAEIDMDARNSKMFIRDMFLYKNRLVLNIANPNKDED